MNRIRSLIDPRNLPVHACVLFVFAILAPPLSAQTVLVDFGSDSNGNSFGLQGWNTLIMSSTLSYTSDGPGGLVADPSVDEYGDYQGVSGTMRSFSTSDRIVVTWYNRSTETVRFTSRISFTDADEAAGGSSSGRWYTMRNAENYREAFTELAPQQSGQTMFAIEGSGVHATDSTYSLVNINLAIEWGSSDMKQYLVCDRIELYEDADTQAPAAPTGLQTASVSDSKINLSWDVPQDNVGVVDYLIYVNGEIEGYSRENAFQCVFLEAETEYRVSVSALDMMRNESARSNELTVETRPFAGGNTLVNPSGLAYLGALRIPETYQWGGEAIAFNAEGDAGGASDGFPGSLFVTNLNQPENGLVGEVSIPAPANVPPGNIESLPIAGSLQAPTNIRPTNVRNWDYVDIWRTGLEYLPDENRLYSAWSIHYTVTGDKHACISACSAAPLSAGPYLGAWHVGSALSPPIDAHLSDWLFALPSTWASAHTADRRLVVGRSRDGGLSGLGPTLYAFAPVGSSPPAVDSELDFTTLLEYGSVEGTDNYHYPDAIDGYKHSDEWREALWLTTGEQSAVAFIGRKAHGDNWYGYHGERMPHEWIIMDVPYYSFDLTDPDGKGWRAHRLSPMIILYDPADLAAVASGNLDSHEPQPYAALRLDPDVFYTEEREIFSAAFDAASGLLYITEFVREADGNLVVHVFRVNTVTGIEDDSKKLPSAMALSNYPNPFRDHTTIQFSLPQSGVVSVRLYDMLGRKVAVIEESMLPAGTHSLRLDAAAHGLPPGMYRCVASAGEQSTQHSVLLLR